MAHLILDLCYSLSACVEADEDVRTLVESTRNVFVFYPDSFDSTIDSSNSRLFELQDKMRDALTQRNSDLLNDDEEFESIWHESTKDLPFFREQLQLPIAIAAIGRPFVDFHGRDLSVTFYRRHDGKGEGPAALMSKSRLKGRWLPPYVHTPFHAALVAHVEAAGGLEHVPGSDRFRQKVMRMTIDKGVKPAVLLPHDMTFYRASKEAIVKAMERSLKEEPLIQRKRVAIIGGDERIHQITWPTDLVEVIPFQGTAANANKIVESAAAGRIDRVIVLARFVPHSVSDVLRGQKHTPVTFWPAGIPRLAKELPQLLGVLPQTGPAPQDSRRDRSAWQDTVLQALVDLDDWLHPTDLIDLLGLPTEYESSIVEALERLRDTHKVVRSDEGNLWRVAVQAPETPEVEVTSPTLAAASAIEPAPTAAPAAPAAPSAAGDFKVRVVEAATALADAMEARRTAEKIYDDALATLRAAEGDLKLAAERVREAQKTLDAALTAT